MICLGIESTAHTFGISIVTSEGDVLSNARRLYTTESGGLIPAKLSDHHVVICDEVVKEALETAQKKLSDIELISFSQSPGMGHSLRIGAAVARSLAKELDVPLIGVNHCIAHLEIGRLKGKKFGDAQNKSRILSSTLPVDDPILLYCSGANTQVIGYEGKKYRVFGETLDNGIGNFLDSFARLLDLGFPGGPKIEALAKKSTNFIELPYSVKGMDVNFGGLITRLDTMINSGKYKIEDLCFSVQETVFAMMVEVSERALAHTGKSQLVLGGGVACNKRLQEMAHLMCKERGATCFVLDNEFNVDNAAMIAWTGILVATNGTKKEIVNVLPITDSKILPHLRTDEVDITWRK